MKFVVWYKYNFLCVDINFKKCFEVMIMLKIIYIYFFVKIEYKVKFNFFEYIFR